MPAAWDAELQHALLARTVAGRKLALYRKLDGTAVALEDACWHRLVPLSMGRLKGRRRAVRLSRAGLQRRRRLYTHAVAGKPSTRRPACAASRWWSGTGSSGCGRAIRRSRTTTWCPTCTGTTTRNGPATGRTIHAACDYRLVVDNLMDLTHETFIHGGSIGNDAVAEAPFEVTHGERTATVTRWMTDIEPPPFWAKQLGRPGRVDRWQIVRFEAPCTVAIDVGRGADRHRRAAGRPQPGRRHGGDQHHLAGDREDLPLFLGQPAGTTGSASSASRPKSATPSPACSTRTRLIVEAQQRAIDANPDHVFYNLNIDAGAMWAAALIDRMVAGRAGGGRWPGRRG